MAKSASSAKLGDVAVCGWEQVPLPLDAVVRASTPGLAQ